MATITYVQFDGIETSVDVAPGHSVMEGAVENGIAGIDADCGGACTCATCHVYIDGDWAERLGKPDSMEEAMLEFAEDVQANSRLSCQIQVTEGMDGLVVHIPERRF